MNDTVSVLKKLTTESGDFYTEVQREMRKYVSESYKLFKIHTTPSPKLLYISEEEILPLPRIEGR